MIIPHPAERSKVMSKRISQANNNGSSGKRCFPIMDMLSVGRENAVSTADLVRMTGCTSSRDLQERIALERGAGALICSGAGKGYWKPKCRQEIIDFVQTMEARAKNTLAATVSARRVLQLPEGQQELLSGTEGMGQ